MKRILACIASVLFISTLVTAEVPQHINIQGRLTDATGSPISDGNHLVKFVIYDAPAGGTELWSSGFLGITVTNGLFSYELGDSTALPHGLFTWDTVRYLGITVGADPELTPRTKLSSGRYAYQSLRSDTADYAVMAVNGSGWVDDGSVVRLNDSTDFVGIGRTNKINGTEFFGVNSDDPTATYGGMYINTPHENGLPFYGYATDGIARTYHFYNGHDDSWSLFHSGGTRISINSEGFVGIGRKFQVTSSELFGIHYPYSGSSYAGMYINHADANGRPFYGYATEGDAKTYHYYNGNVVTDGEGYATVTMPDWFEALNRDFRYQLTVIGEFAQAIIAKEISNRQFTIQTDKPNVKVSWQVTGIRQDKWANANRIQVELDKPEHERGKYFHPEAHLVPEEMGIAYQMRQQAEAIDQEANKTSSEIE